MENKNIITPDMFKNMPLERGLLLGVKNQVIAICGHADLVEKFEPKYSFERDEESETFSML